MTPDDSSPHIPHDAGAMRLLRPLIARGGLPSHAPDAAFLPLPPLVLRPEGGGERLHGAPVVGAVGTSEPEALPRFAPPAPRATVSEPVPSVPDGYEGFDWIEPGTGVDETLARSSRGEDELSPVGLESSDPAARAEPEPHTAAPPPTASPEIEEVARQLERIARELREQGEIVPPTNPRSHPLETLISAYLLGLNQRRGDG